MTPLRKKMIQAMRQRGFSPRTHKSYLAAAADLARYFHKSPDKIEASELQSYFDYLVQDRNLSPASCRVYLNGVRFLYLKVLEWPSFDVKLVVSKRPQRIPELLTRADVKGILAACHNPKHKMLLELTYGCGLRVSEVVNLRVRDIDGDRCLLRLVQAKGAKDHGSVRARLNAGILSLIRVHSSQTSTSRQGEMAKSRTNTQSPARIFTGYRIGVASEEIQSPIDKSARV